MGFKFTMLLVQHKGGIFNSPNIEMLQKKVLSGNFYYFFNNT